MKLCTRVVLGVVLLSLLASRAAADSSLRLEAGATTARTDELASTPGFTLGGAVALTRWAPLASVAFVPHLELLFAHRHASALVDGAEHRSPTLDVLELPLVLRGALTLGRRTFHLMGGAYGSVLLRAQTRDDSGVVERAAPSSPVDVGWVAGGGLTLASLASGELSLEVRYQRPSLGFWLAGEGRPETLSLLLGYEVRSRRSDSLPAGAPGPSLALRGIYGSLLLDAQRSHEGRITDMGDAISSVNAGWIVGGGLELFSGATVKPAIELRYQRGFRNLLPAGPGEVNQQTVSCLLSITYGSPSPADPQEPTPDALYSSNEDGATKTPSTKRVTSVVRGRPGDRWLDTMRFTRIERVTRDGRHGYEIRYDIAGHGHEVLFWPRDRIDFDGRSPGSRLKTMKLRKGRLWYPWRITSRTLPRVHQGILEIEEAYAKDADGAISAMKGFVIVAGLGGLKPTLRTTPSAPYRSTAPRGSSRAVSPSPTGAAARAVPKVHMGQQGKHILGHPNYIEGRSILRADPARLAQRAGSGTPVGKVPRGQPGFRERINFGEVIGDFVKDGVATLTTKGIIHYGKAGIHIVPAAP